MRYPACEKLEIIQIVEQSQLAVRRTLDTLWILPGSFYRSYDKYLSGGARRQVIGIVARLEPHPG